MTSHLLGTLKRVTQQALRRAGIEVRRVSSSENRMPPPLYDDPFEALHYARNGRPAAFKAPLDKSVLFNGFSHAPGGWSPFVAALRDYGDDRCTTYEGSVLQKFYECWQPAHLLEAMMGQREGPEALTTVPPYVILYPWSAATIEERLEHRKYFTELENEERGFEDLKLEAGYKFQGPIDPRKARLEFKRLVTVYESLKAAGYDRSQGDTRTLIIKRGDEVRFLDRRGHHRRAAMAVLGYETIPARFKLPRCVDVADVDYWPQVRSGRWDRETALRYIDHLFDFDARAWACEHGLLRE